MKNEDMFFTYLMVGKIYSKNDIESNGGKVALRPSMKKYIGTVGGNVYCMEEYKMPRETSRYFKCVEAIISKQKLDTGE